jgi:hypothetical protein
MKCGPITSGLLGVLALALSATSTLAQPGNLGGSSQQALSVANGPLVLVRGAGGHGFGGGGHGFHGGHFRGGFAFDAPYYYYDDGGEAGCSWSARYHRWICY